MTKTRFERIVDLVEGFESSFGLELLATVHWVVAEENAETMEDVVARIYSCDTRKEQFPQRQLALAVEVFTQQGWINRALLGAPAPF